jgi:DNA mismatch endonuclease (patch repair protein)
MTRECFKNPVFLKAFSEKIKQGLSDPAVRQKISEKLKGKPKSDEHKRKLSEAKKGCLAWNKGLTKDIDARLRRQGETRKLRIKQGLIKPYRYWLGKKRDVETTRKVSLTMKGKHYSTRTEFKKGCKSPMQDKHHSVESNFKNSLSHLGQSAWNKGKHQSIETIEKIRAKRLLQRFPLKATQIELIVQDFLKMQGIPFKANFPIENIAQVDMFIEPNICIFIDGCYWHGCPVHFPNRHRARDELINQKLQARGYKVLRLWEHDILKKHYVAQLEQELRIEPILLSTTVQKINERLGDS